MGIGSFFASLFQKDNDSQKEIRELNIEPTQKERAAAAKAEDSQIKEKASSVLEKPASRGTEALDRGRRTVSDNDKSEAVHDIAAGNQRNVRQEERQAQARREYFQAKKDLYNYLNQTMRILYQADQEDSWEGLTGLEGPSENACNALADIKEELPESLWELMSPFLNEHNIASPSELRPAFISMLLPFYPAYSKEFGEFRYNTFLNRDALELFRRLTGRKFRLGYRNRYANGRCAFEWKGEQFRVYNKKGTLLCDAVFENGIIRDGYAVILEESTEGSEWTVLRKGSFKDGQFLDGALEYVYGKSIDL